MAARKRTETLDVTNWMSFIHHMYGASLHMGPVNFNSIQLALEFWDGYAEVTFLKDQKHIIYFLAGTFRCNNKYTYRGGISHFSHKGQENADYLMSSGLKIEKASYGDQKQPAITPVPHAKIQVDSWENRLAALAVDMINHPDKEEYREGYILDPEEADASPLASMTLKIYLQVLQRAINYEKKRKVIGKLNEAKEEIKEYILETKKETKEYLDETRKEYGTMRLQLLQDREDLIRSQNELSLIQEDCKQKTEEIKEDFNIILEISEEIEQIENKLGKKISKRKLAKILSKTVKERSVEIVQENLTNDLTSVEIVQENLTNDLTSVEIVRENLTNDLTSVEIVQENLTTLLVTTFSLKKNLTTHFQFMLVCLEFHPHPIRQSTAYKRLKKDRQYFQNTVRDLESEGLITKQNKYYYTIPTEIVKQLSKREDF